MTFVHMLRFTHTFLATCLATLLVITMTGCGGGGGNSSVIGSAAISEARAGLAISQSDPYEMGPYSVQLSTLAQGQSGIPRDSLLVTPTEPGRYAIVQFQHGFILDVDFYRVILARLGEHGFIVLAPQMYPPGGQSSNDAPSVADEADAAIEINNWVRNSIADVLPSGVEPEPVLLGVAGHSRGGQVAWRMLNIDDGLALGIAGVDPVDGSGAPGQGPGELITDSPFGLPYASLVLGTGLGTDGGVFNMPCAPPGQNHEQFYAASASPAYHTIANDHGHVDMLDDSCGAAQPECAACTQGAERVTMRRFTGGQLVAFFRTVLQGVDSRSILTTESLAPLSMTAEAK